jgi:polyisoprenoid-binding protein YceI
MARSTALCASSSVEWSGTRGTMQGELTITGVSRPVTLDVEYLGHVRDPWGNDRAVFSAAGQLNREAWGLTWNLLLETGGLVVSKDIRLEIEVETLRQAP